MSFENTLKRHYIQNKSFLKSSENFELEIIFTKARFNLKVNLKLNLIY